MERWREGERDEKDERAGKKKREREREKTKSSP